MGEAIGAVLVFATGIALSPFPIIAVILVLFSARAKVNGPLFLLGWLVGLSVVAAATYLTSSAIDVGTDPTADDAVDWVRLVLGVLLLVAAARKWRSRPGPDEPPEMPGWMTKLDDVAPARAAGLGALLSFNPKNVMLALAAAANLAQLQPTSAEAAVALGVFVVVSSAAVIAAVAYATVGGERSRSSLDSAKAWLTANNAGVMAVLFVVFGALLISNGLGAR